MNNFNSVPEKEWISNSSRIGLTHKVETSIVSFKFLLSLYLIIPLCLSLYFIDRYLLGGQMFSGVASVPEQYLFFQVVIGTPHIIASSVILFTNKDYIHLYKRRTAIAALVILAFLTVGSLTLSYQTLFIIISSLSVIHVIKQQIGICNGINRFSGIVYSVWVWSGIGSSVLLYNIIYVRFTFDAAQIAVADKIILLLIVSNALLTISVQRYSRSKLGRLFFCANFAMMAVPVYLYFCGYFFLAVISPRVIHDVTAFSVYIVHDKNRHQSQAQNWIYRLASKYHLSIYWVSPLFAIVLAYIVQKKGDVIVNFLASCVVDLDGPIKISLGVVVFLSLFHYYTETFTWGKLSPYRKFVAFG